VRTISIAIHLRPYRFVSCWLHILAGLKKEHHSSGVESMGCRRAPLAACRAEEAVPSAFVSANSSDQHHVFRETSFVEKELSDGILIWAKAGLLAWLAGRSPVMNGRSPEDA
jgi:hypothetical protein